MTSLARKTIRLSPHVEPAFPPAPGSTAAEWHAHVDAGRIGRPAPAAPEVVARRTAMVALFARAAGGRA